MKNLAGDAKCDRYIEEELKRSMITIVPYDGQLTEVPSRLRGMLGPLTFWRAWYYWIVTGPVPLAVAKELYADPIGVTDVRVAGHCGCPAPEAPWINWITKDGARVVETAQRAEYEIASRRWPDAFAKAGPIVWSDSPETIADGFVTTYHVDSEAGLRLLCDTLRKHGIDKQDPPTWWNQLKAWL